MLKFILTGYLIYYEKLAHNRWNTDLRTVFI
jgi:hypothetical protein